jgi:hypothetical protein
MVGRRGRWVLASVTGAALVIGAVIRLRARRGLSQADAPADVGFMRALHAALRRDLSRLRDAAAQLDGSAGAPPAVLAGWDRPEFLTWILDDAGEQDAAAVLTEMPPPARLVYGRVLHPRYDARHRWQIPGPAAKP